MGIVSSTQFVPSGGVVVAESVQPCHLFGDPELFGIGIRVSFYFQYFTAGFILLYSGWLKYKARPDDPARVERLKGDLHNLRISLTVLGLALFLALCINSTGDSLVILDWAIVSLLVLMGTLIVGVPLLESVVVLFYLKTKEAVAEIQYYRAEGDYDDVLLQNLAARRRHADTLMRNYYLASCISRNAAQRNVLLREARDDRIRMAVRSWNEYNATFQERDHHPGRVERDESDRIRNELWLNEFDLRTLQDQMEDASRQLRKDASEAESQRERVKQFEKQWLGASVRRLFVWQDMQNAREDLMPESMSAGFLLLTWTAYLAAMPWLYFRGLYNGTKPGTCDIRIPLFYYPLTIYSQGFITFMRVGAVMGLALYGPALFYSAVWYIRQGYRYGAAHASPAVYSTSSTETGLGKAEEDRVKRLREEFSTEFGDPEPPLFKAAITWYIRCIIPLWIITTIVVAELAIIQVNHIHVNTTVASTGQLIALVAALGQFAMTLWHACGPVRVRDSLFMALLECLGSYS
ncbi:hypothetical protein MMYC01_204728 [Madurella mycetomatis]|uniref:Uncharacterized protein n=1 Tax=Madurella mycetomatis TaxID=100816 RepID=A0A175W5F2_9PEZI|nr:hypothetical protein MMYC01_204728 [Madurella mycetomatis]